MCNFKTGFKPPEMIKVRPVVIVSRKHDQVCTVVPLSTVESYEHSPCYVEISPESLPRPLSSRRCWAKCDMLSTVAHWRLDRIQEGKHPRTGQRLYTSPLITPEDLAKIRAGIRYVLEL